jgi:hypothetical protein
MKKIVGLVLCLSLSSFIVTRAAKPTHALRSHKEITSQELCAKSASLDMFNPDQHQIAADQQDGSGDDNQNASGNEGVNDQQDGAADAGEQDNADDAEAVDNGTDDPDDGGGE